MEFDRFSDGSWGRFGTIVRLNGDPSSTCPSYFVQEAGGGLTLSYVCSRVRLATKNQPDAKPGARPPQAANTPPKPGHYFCHYGVNRPQLLGPGRNFWLRPGGQYAADDGDSGAYTYDEAAGKITFRGGFFGRMGAVGEYKSAQPNQIDIHPPNGLLSYCSLQ